MPNHRFGRQRPGQDGLSPTQDHEPNFNQPFHPLPQPTGDFPFRLKLSDVLAPEQIATIEAAGRLVFHCCGDTGAVQGGPTQKIVADKMEAQLHGSDAERAQFFYHLGDIAYFTGDTSDYYRQFYDPYEFYTAPIFAIPGNHDVQVTRKPSNEPALFGFMENFCAARRGLLRAEAGETGRTAMTQPHCHFTLEAPFATIIGLYTNEPEGGQVKDEQWAWFETELQAAPRDKALLVALHHPPFSLDKFHSGSRAMATGLDRAFERTGRMPAAVLSGHVHDYQRFTRTVGQGQASRKVIYLVAGAGGYRNLHTMQPEPGGGVLQTGHEFAEWGLKFEAYRSDRHGFVRLMVDGQHLKAAYFTVPRPQESWSAAAHLDDEVTIDWRNGQII